MAQVQVFDLCLATFALFAPRVIHMSSMHLCVTADWYRDCAHDRPILVIFI